MNSDTARNKERFNVGQTFMLEDDSMKRKASK